MQTTIRGTLLAVALCLGWLEAPAAEEQQAETRIGVAKVEITPEGPIRLTGYGNRREEATEVVQRLYAKALVVENAGEELSVLITVDLLGVPGELTEELAGRLKDRLGIEREQLAICATHTHTGPKLTGVAPALFGGPLPAEHRERVDRYTRQLVGQLEELTVAAHEDLRPGRLAWGQGEVDFAVDRRRIEDGRWVGWGAVANEHLDHDLPVMAVEDTEGNLRALLVNYACHCTTLVGEHNFIHGDWAGEAAARLEAAHEGAIALIAIGCGANANPEPRGELEHVAQHGQAIAVEVARVLEAGLTPLSSAPTGSIEQVRLPFEPITRDELEARRDGGGLFAYSASMFLDALERGEEVPNQLAYDIQLWRFGDQLAMFFMPGEVVADYAIRMKGELDGARIWMNAYANGSPSYIASRRMIGEGGYEVDASMAYYHQPNRYQPVIEDLLMEAMRGMVDEAYDRRWDDAEPAELKGDNRPRRIEAGEDGSLNLTADAATPYGPRIEYMPEPEWRAMGWWTDQDYLAWEIDVPAGGTYEVHKTWSVADDSSHRPYLLEVADRRLRGFVKRTGAWDNFETESIGRIPLEAGKQRLTLKPAGAFGHGGLMDLRALRLVPVEEG